MAGSTVAATEEVRALMDRAVHHLVATHTPKGTRIGWLMIGSILVEAWDLYSIAFVLIFLRQIFHPSPLLLGLAAAGTQGGALIGALIGGWLSDRIGRRSIFLSTMIAFVVLAIAQAFAPNMTVLAIIRVFLGIPLGSDISNGYTYIMDAMRRGDREVMGNRWQFMFAAGELASIAVITLMIALGVAPDILWRVALAIGAIPAIVIFIFRYNLPEAAIWLIRRGRFSAAKRIAREMYGDPLDFLPDHDVDVPRPGPAAFFGDLRRDDRRWRATIFGWIAGFSQSGEFSTFAFYLPVLFVLLGVSDIIGTNLILLGLFSIALISGLVGPALTPRIGQRNLSIAGFAIVFVSLIAAAIGIYTKIDIILPIAAATMLWGHYWDAENVVTIPSVVAKPEYRGTASGFAYVFVKLPAFLSIFLFPALFEAIGKGNATLFTALFPLLGLCAAIFILPEMYGHAED